jgi:hypothetical protein
MAASSVSALLVIRGHFTGWSVRCSGAQKGRKMTHGNVREKVDLTMTDHSGFGWMLLVLGLVIAGSD